MSDDDNKRLAVGFEIKKIWKPSTEEFVLAELDIEFKDYRFGGTVPLESHVVVSMAVSHDASATLQAVEAALLDEARFLLEAVRVLTASRQLQEIRQAALAGAAAEDVRLQARLDAEPA